jgi:hypothetical protein
MQVRVAVEESDLRVIRASVVVVADLGRRAGVFDQVHEEASPSIMSSFVLLVQQCQALSARHRGPVIRRDALHFGAMGGFLVTRVT